MEDIYEQAAAAVAEEPYQHPAQAAVAVAYSDLAVEEAAPKPEKPDGAPDLWPFLKLPRRSRASFLRAIGVLQLRSTELEEARAVDGGEEGTASPEIAAATYDLLADAEDVLVMTAPPGREDVVRDWCAAASDEAVMQLLRWYMDRFDVGEAQASPHS
jgi:hypothetical protein